MSTGTYHHRVTGARIVIEDTMNEKTIEQKLCKAVSAIGGWSIKLTSPTAAGLPDRMILLPDGHLAFVEVKAPGKKPRILQTVQMKKLKKLGFDVFVLDEPSQIPGILEEIKNHAVHTS